MATEKRKINRVIDANGNTVQVLPETSAEQVTVADAGDKFTSTNVEGVLQELATGIAQAGKVDDVQDVNGASIVTNKIAKLSKAAVGLGNVDNTADANKSVKYATEAGKTTNSFSVLGQDSTGVEKSVTFDGSATKEVAFNEDDFNTTLSGNALEVSIVDKGYALKTYVDTQDDKKYDKSGGTISGNVTITGDLAVKGTTTTIDTQNLEVKDNLITVAKDNTTALTSPAGLFVPKYDGTNNIALVVDNDGMAKVGKATLVNGNITDKSNLQTLATRTGLVDGSLVKYDGTNQTLVPVNDGDTIDESIKFTNTKGIYLNRIHTVNGSAILDFDGTNLRLGQTTLPLHLRGSKTRPQYTTDGTTFKDIALVEDIAGTKVDNATHADSADNATNVTTNINGKAITSIFESDGTTAKKATSAGTADSLKNEFVFGAADQAGTGAVSVGFDGENTASVGFDGNDFYGVFDTYQNDLSMYLRPTGVTAGQYSAVNVDAKGRVTAGGKSIEWGTSGQTTPSDSLMVGGLFMELQS